MRTGRSEGILVLPRDFLSLFFLRRHRMRSKGPGFSPLRPILSPSIPFFSLSFYRSYLALSECATERDRKAEGTKVRRGGREILTRISLQAREESRRSETKERKRERDGEGRGEGAWTPREKSSRSLPPTCGRGG